MTDFPKRHAISRARFFLEQAEQCSPTDQDAFESYLDAAIIFGRTAIHRLKTEHEKHREWKNWFESLRTNPTIKFFWKHRDIIIHKSPLPIGQIISFNPVHRAAELYYFDDSKTPATETVRRHLDRLADIVAEGDAKFTPKGPLPAM